MDTTLPKWFLMQDKGKDKNANDDDLAEKNVIGEGGHHIKDFIPAITVRAVTIEGHSCAGGLEESATAGMRERSMIIRVWAYLGSCYRLH